MLGILNLLLALGFIGVGAAFDLLKRWIPLSLIGLTFLAGFWFFDLTSFIVACAILVFSLLVKLDEFLAEGDVRMLAASIFLLGYLPAGLMLVALSCVVRIVAAILPQFRKEMPFLVCMTVAVIVILIMYVI